MVAASGVDTHLPKGAHGPFFGFAVLVGISLGFYDRLFGAFDATAAGAEEPFNPFSNSSFFLVGKNAPFDSSHRLFVIDHFAFSVDLPSPYLSF